MAKYEPLKTIKLSADNTYLHLHKVLELVHLDDPAFAVMTDFTQTSPRTIGPDEPMDNALNEMKIHGVHLLLVQDDHDKVIGIIASEDILGERPIKII